MAPELTRLGDSNQIRVTMNWRDHDPPHFHVEIVGKADATVGIESLAIEDGSLPKGERDLVLRWAKDHQDELRVAWELASRLIHPGKIEPT